MALMTTVGLELIARNRANKQISSFNRSIQKMGRQLLAVAGVGGGIYALTRAIQSAIRNFIAFEKQMAMVSTMLDSQTMQLMPSYAAALKKIAVKYGEGTETLSKGLYDILSASIAPQKAIKVLTASVKAAKAGFTTTAIAADAITTVLNSYGLEAEKAAEVSDKLFAVVKRGKTTFAELAPNIGKVTSIANVAGLSLDELGAAIATMTRGGLQTEIAITSLRSIITQFIKPTEEAKKAAASFGLELDSSTLKTIGLSGALKKLSQASAEQLVKIIPNVRGLAGFATALKQVEEYGIDMQIMMDSAGRTQEAFEKTTSTMGFAIDRLKQSWQMLGIELASKPALTAPIDALTDTLERLRLEAQKTPWEIIKDLWKITPPGILYRGIKEARKPPTIPSEAVGRREYPMPEMTRRILAMGRKQIEERLRQEEELMAGIAAMNARRMEMEEVFGKKMLADEEKRAKDAYKFVIKAAEREIEAVRYMHWMTRLEKIKYLEDYLAAYKGTTGTILEVEEMLQDEITRITRSRVNQMTVYYAELSEKMQERGLWLAENFANAMRSIQGSMGSMFYDTMKDAENWVDHLEGFFKNVVDAFQRMIADMLAEYLMLQAITGIGQLVYGPTPAVSGQFPTTPSGAPYIPAGQAPGGLQYGGVVERTGLAVVHRGETYSGVGGGKTEIIISYTGQERHEVSAEEFVGAFNETIIQINMQAMEGNIAYQNAMKRAVR